MERSKSARREGAARADVASTGLPPCRRLTNLLIWLTTTCCWLMCAAPLCAVPLSQTCADPSHTCAAPPPDAWALRGRWLITYMMQLHPLIEPIPVGEE